MLESTHRQLLSASLLLSIAPCCIASAASSRQPDFNGDGFADLIMPAPGEKIGAAKDAGAINIVYGTADGLKSDGNPTPSQMLSQGADGLGDTPENGDRFGRRCAFGDFNGDGFSDLIASATGEDASAGAVTVIYGSPSGLVASDHQTFRLGQGGVLGTPESAPYFGWSVAVGDFNGDGKDDLAIAATDEDAGGSPDSGAVHVLYGSASGLSAVGNQMWYQGGGGLQGLAEAGDYFGMAMAAGDFDGDGKDDLAVGCPYENGNGTYNCGAVNVIYGSGSGLTSAKNQFWHQDSAGIANSINGYEYFGWALAAGDFNNDGKADLAIGADSENVDGKADAGAVHVLYGSGNKGLRGTGSQFWTQNSSGVADDAEAKDRFGASLSVGDFNGDGIGDLLIGALNEAVGSKNLAGAVHVLYGSAGKLSGAGGQFWSQDSNGVAGAAAGGDTFGSTLLVGDFNGDGKDDLGVGVPFEKVGGASGAGAINVLYGAANKGLKAAGNQLWTQDSPGVADKCEKDDNVGYGNY